MNVCEAIKTQGLNEVVSSLKLKMKEYDDRIVLNYVQGVSPKNHPIVNECRGLILRKNTYEILCRPFDRFFNLGEVEMEVDWKNAVCYEKVDGSLTKVYHDGVDWCIATRGTAFAEGGSGFEFRELMFKAFKVNNQEELNSLFNDLDKNSTHLFEFTSLENRIVTIYSGYTMWYLSSRRNDTGEVYRLENVEQFNAVLPKVYKFGSKMECDDAISSLPTLEEGYVVYINGIPSLKIKSPKYVEVHHSASTRSPGKLLEIFLNKETDEFILHFPEYKEKFEEFQNVYDSLMKDSDDYILNNKNIKQEEFIKNLEGKKYRVIAISARNKCSSDQAFENMTLKKKMSFFK